MLKQIIFILLLFSITTNIGNIAYAANWGRLAGAVIESSLKTTKTVPKPPVKTVPKAASKPIAPLPENVPANRNDASWQYRLVMVRCSNCNGTGKVYNVTSLGNQTCQTCRGTGKITTTAGRVAREIGVEAAKSLLP